MRRWNINVKYLKFSAIPLVTMILIAIILIADKPADTMNPETSAEETVAETTVAETTSQPLDSQAAAQLDTPLAKDSIPEINSLMETYFQARISCDTQAISQIFEAGSLGDENAMAERMGQQTEHIETYQNISCYTKAGLEADSYIVFTRFDIKFYRTDTLAPSLLWCYVRKGEDGSYRIVEVPDEKTSLYITEVEKTDEVVELSKSVNQALEEAIASDGKLASIYNILRSGFMGEETTESESTAETTTAQ